MISLRRTIRGRLLFLAVTVELLMLTILVANSLRLQHGAMTTQARLQAEQMYPVLKAALTAPMAQRDYATVQAVISESRAAGGVDYICIVDTSGHRVAANGWPNEQPLPTQSVSFSIFASGKAPRYDVVVPISYLGQQLGTLHFGLNLSQIIVARRSLLIQGASIATVELLLSTVILFFLGYWITRHLTALTQASIQVASGNLPPPLVPEGNDDIGKLGAAFNTMSRVISDRVRDLNEQAEILQDEVDERRKAQELLLLQQGQLETLNLDLEKRVADEVLKNREKDQALLQSEKMASIGQLAAGVAHEINNPMGFISSNLRTLSEYFIQIVQFDRILQDSIGNDMSQSTLEIIEEQREALEIDYVLSDGTDLINESLGGAKRVTKIVQDLKNFSRLDALECESVLISSCMESALTICYNELKYIATIKKEYEPVPEVACHPGQLNQVFLNLLVNAGHSIEPPGEILLKSWYDGTFVYASVSDSGCGISEEIRNRIFEPFFTTKDVGKGTGLGLSLSYEIIKRHEGELLVESVVGKGTTFTVKLPFPAPQVNS
jgi:signal transduction histidine kinase